MSQRPISLCLVDLLHLGKIAAVRSDFIPDLAEE